MKIVTKIMLVTLFAGFFLRMDGQCLNLNSKYVWDCNTSSAYAWVIVGTQKGTPPFTYTWLPGGQQTATVTNLPPGGYTVQVTDATGCKYFTIIVIVNAYLPSNLSLTSTMVTCYGTATGTSQAKFTGSPNLPFTYNWKLNGVTMFTTTTANGMPAGEYEVTVQDSKGCEVTKSLTITQPPQITSVLTPTNIPCAGEGIQGAITTTGGVSAYTYSVNNIPVSSAPIVFAGINTVTTKDTKSCTVTNTILVIEEPADQITFTVQSPSCKSKSDGSISANITGLYPPYTYSWFPVAGNGPDVQNVPMGNYTLSTISSKGCLTSSIVNVTPLPGPSTAVATRAEDCSAADGAFTISLTGGNPPFTFTTLPVLATGSIVTGLSTGNYSVVWEDSKNCLDTMQVQIDNFSPVKMSVVNSKAPLCYNVCDGSFDVATLNAVLPVTYSVTGSPTTTTASFTSVCPGFYIIKAMDDVGCAATATLHFASPAVFTYSSSSPSVICIGSAATLTATADGGAPGYKFSWEPGALLGSAVSVHPKVTTNYSLNVYDGNGCTHAPFIVTVQVLPELDIQIKSSQAGICPGSTANITPSVAGGDGKYSYDWQPGNFNQPSIYVDNISVPEYTLTVKDGCGSPPVTERIPIKLFPVTKPTYKTTADSGCMPLCTRFINTTAGSSGVVWNFGDQPLERRGDTTAYCYQRAGTFSVRMSLTDSNSCKASHIYQGSVKVRQKPDVSYVTEPAVLTLNNADKTILRNTSSHATSFTWYINGLHYSHRKDLEYNFREVGCTDIRLLAYDNSNCRDSVEKSVCVSEGFNFYMPAAFTPNEDGLNDEFKPKGSGWMFSDYLMEVYNRWGGKVFRSTEPEKGWDGGVRPDPAVPDAYRSDPNDIYAWKVTVTDNEGNTHIYAGNVMVVR
jgi:gliding motility-associated-like protein